MAVLLCNTRVKVIDYWIRKRSAVSTYLIFPLTYRLQESVRRDTIEGIHEFHVELLCTKFIKIRSTFKLHDKIIPGDLKLQQTDFKN